MAVFDPDYDLFARIVEAGSLAAAGRSMELSAPMVSKRLARLERRLGVQLVNRTTRRLSLTAAGERFHGDVAAIRAAIAAAEARLIGNAQLLTGTLRIAAPTSFGRLHVAPHMAGFLDAHPGLAIQLNLSDRYADLVGERIDVAIRIAATLPPQLDGRRLATSARILCAAPAYIARHDEPRTIAVLRRHRLLAAEGQLPWRLDGPHGSVIVDATSHVRTNSSEVVRELALAGVGIALRSLWDVGEDLAAGRLVRVLADHRGSADMGIYAAYPRAALVPRPVTAFITYFRDLYAGTTVAGWSGIDARSEEQARAKT